MMGLGLEVAGPRGRRWEGKQGDGGMSRFVEGRRERLELEARSASEEERQGGGREPQSTRVVIRAILTPTGRLAGQRQ